MGTVLHTVEGWDDGVSRAKRPGGGRKGSNILQPFLEVRHPWQCPAQAGQ